MNIVLYYPRMGMSGSLVSHLPLSLLYASIGAMQAGFAIRIVDARLNPNQWQESLVAAIDSQTVLLGISVMSGVPILNASEVSRWSKAAYPALPVVWGGPHATFNGPDILKEEPWVDFSISGYGSEPLAALCAFLTQADNALPLAAIRGLNYRQDGCVLANPANNQFEFVDFRLIPYHLVADQMDLYGQFNNGERVFPLYSSMGCPYQCTFCSSPAQYREIRRKYQTYPHLEVVDHIEMVQTRYGATYIYFIDDDSFVQLAHVERIIDEITRRGIRVQLGFRGARINEIMKMSDAFLSKLAAAGTDILHIGAESGSQRSLDMIKKNCTVEDIIAVNRKLARHPEISSGYNWIMGLPGETMADLHATRHLMIRLIADNPAAMIFSPNLFRPLPNTQLFERALEYGYRPPIGARQWAEVENNVESDNSRRSLPWCSHEMIRFIEMLQLVTNFIDGKIFKIKLGDTWKFRILKLLARIYTPLAWLRMRTGYAGLLFEKTLLQWISRLGWF
ncbi:MAG: B12-binding domain-containing radical SAM protein [Magnetococcales bacterium]|nr:B12-binding domain-containing radical SAM protein [Magnetococcales bacterium]